MKSKSALLALAVVVLMGSMAVAALADDQEMNVYANANSSFWPEPEQGTAQPEAAEIREPMETGAVPDRSGSSSDLHSNRPGDEPAVEAVEYGGLKYRSIDLP